LTDHNARNHRALIIAVLTSRQDDVEIVNKTLRDAGHPAHCLWVETPEALEKALRESTLELVVLSCDHYPDSIRQVIGQKEAFQPELPILAMRGEADEAAILDAMEQGARDLVPAGNAERLRVVVTRELRACRIERALNSTLVSASTYRKQLHDYMEGSSSAIAYVQEGIVTNINRAWVELFKLKDKTDVVGLPLMDSFESESQAAVKGAIIATTKRKWQPDETVAALAKLDGNNAETLKLNFQLVTFDDGDQVQIRIAPRQEQPEEPTKLVHDALKRDPTTLFFHRAQFLERITKRLARKPKSGVHVLVYIKPDDFSMVCESVGLIQSEETLAQLAEVVRKRLHPRDVAGRFEGTVIMALLERGSEADAEVWAKQLLDKVEATKFLVDETETNFTCTVGVCSVSGAFEDMNDFVSAAAQAHAQGKRRGGNCVALNDSLDDSTRIKKHDALWLQRIRAALMENRFRLAQLPIAGLRSDDSDMVDMLIRMIDEQGSPVLPSEFLPAAERNNVLKNIDRWMIAAALPYCAENDTKRAFVRLSNQSLRDHSIIQWLEMELKKTAASPGQLCLQVAEKDAARYIRDARHITEALRKLGVAFALEHYGAHNERLQILDMLQPDYIKIDGELMHSLMTDTALQEQVRRLVAAADQRGIETIAERVENANAMAVLFQIGIHYMQGHYVHEPEVVLQEQESNAAGNVGAAVAG